MVSAVVRISADLANARAAEAPEPSGIPPDSGGIFPAT
jgi:hypothetical protein